jgi:predicted adenylyl cyclase CyaB
VAAESIEIEIQVKVENVQALFSFLEKNAQFIGEERQVDEYFTPKHRDFASVRPVKEWLRLRDEKGKFTLTYKNWRYNENGKSESCDEFETSVKDISQLKKMFAALDMKTVVKVDKIRKMWKYKDYEISIDYVAGLGDFVEIEFNGVSSDDKKVTDEMVRFLKEIGVGKIQRSYQGYAFSMMAPEEVEYFEV